MNLENVTVEMRPRSEWEAADFGVRMIRRDAAAIYRVWFAVTLPLLALALLMIIYTPYPALATLLYWWLEPVADGPILRIISRRLFGEEANVGASIRSVLILARRNWIFLLPPYRFHFARSTAMPITQLEGLSGSTRRSRAKVLNLKIMNHGTGVTVAYQHLALALYLGVILLGYALVPTGYQDSVGENWMGMFWEETSTTASILGLLLVYFAQTALQPWFVGAGFGLYINCRTQLEAWDIEVAFRRMVQRRVGGLATALVLALLIAPAVILPQPAYAQSSQQTQLDADDPGFSGFWDEEEIQAGLKTALADDALKTTREVEEWYSTEPDDESPASRGTSGNWERMLRDVGKVMSFVVEFGLWIGAAFLLYLVFATRKHWLPYLERGPSTKRSATRVILSSGELTADSMPDDVPSEVMRLWNAGEKRQALGLLYRSCVFSAVTRHGVRLPHSATEGVCVAAIGQQTDVAQSDYFRKVVSAWIRCAYGYRIPEDDLMLPLCNEWPQHYGEPS